MPRRFRVLVIGVGSIGERHLRCFINSGRAECSLVEVTPALRHTVAERYGVTNCFGDLESALANPPEIAVIAAPAPFHIPMAQQLAEAGVHLLVEKPLSTSVDGVQRLIDTVREKQLTAAVGYTWRNHPSLTAMRRAVQERRFGRPVQLVAVTGQNFPTYRPAYRTIYYNNHATGGGAIQDALTHIVNAGEWLVGPVERLVVDASHQVLEGVEVEDTVNLLARQGSVLASYSLNQHQVANELTLSVICDQGIARFESHKRRWRWMTGVDSQWQEERIEPFDRDRMYIDQAHAFLDAVENQSRPLCTLEEGLQTLRVNLAALESARTSAWKSLGT